MVEISRLSYPLIFKFFIIYIDIINSIDFEINYKKGFFVIIEKAMFEFMGLACNFKLSTLIIICNPLLFLVFLC